MINLGMTREEVVAVLGEPDDKGGTSRKYKTPRIYRYGGMEFWFEPWKSGGLCQVCKLEGFKIMETGLSHARYKASGRYVSLKLRLTGYGRTPREAVDNLQIVITQVEAESYVT